MPQLSTRNKTRKRRSRQRGPKQVQGTGAGGAMQAGGKEAGRDGRGSSVAEMPEEQAKSRTGRVGEQGAVIVSPTGTKHRPVKKTTPRLARSRAKSPELGKQKPGRTAKSHRAQSGRADQRAGIGRRSS